MFWAWCGTPVLHDEYHWLVELREQEYRILEAAKARVKAWNDASQT